MASTTKIMTAIIFLENGGLNKKVVYTKYAFQTPFGNMHFPIGTTLSATDALKGMLIPSSNDLATAVALSICDEKTFVEKMNQKAKVLGMKNTHFVNVHGLDAKNHYSTCYDLAILGSYAMKNSTFRDCMKPKATIKLNIKNTTKNKIVTSTFKNFYSFPGALGVKTGTTKGAGKCFVGYVKRDNIPIITTVLGDDDAVQETKAIVNYTFRHCQYETILRPGEKYEMTFGKKKISVKPGDFVKVFVDPKEVKLKHEIVPVCHYPIAKNSLVGYVKVFDGERLICKKPVYSMKTYLGTGFDYFFIIFVLCVVGLIFYLDNKTFCHRIIRHLVEFYKSKFVK